MNFLLMTTAMLLLAGLQACLPSWWWLGGVRLELLPALVAYGALTFRHRRWILTLAIVAGLLQDALSAAPFGNSVVAYFVVAFLLMGLRRFFDRETLWMQMSAGAFASVAVSVAACAVIGFGGVVPKISLLALMSAVVTPLVFFVSDGLRWMARPA
jgi:rod shape-determining protein MreD